MLSSSIPSVRDAGNTQMKYFYFVRNISCWKLINHCEAANTFLYFHTTQSAAYKINHDKLPKRATKVHAHQHIAIFFYWLSCDKKYCHYAVLSRPQLVALRSACWQSFNDYREVRGSEKTKESPSARHVCRTILCNPLRSHRCKN